MNSVLSTSKKAAFSLLLLSIVVLALSAFSYPARASSQGSVAHLSPYQQAVLSGKVQPDFGTFTLQPGQDTWLRLSAQQAKRFGFSAIHVQTGGGIRTTIRSNIVSTASTTCDDGLWTRETADDNSWWYQITLDFCYNGSSITYISPVHPSSATCCFWGMSNNGTSSYNGGSWGYGHGSYSVSNFGGLGGTHNGDVEIDLNGNGNFSWWGD